jgi:phage terminase small subunit
MAKEITKKMRDFADYYLETGNIYQSAIKAGYSENYAKTNASRLLEKDSVKNYINETLEEIQSRKIASIQEVMEYLTKGIRQELEEEVIVVEGLGDGCSEAIIKKKKISLRDSNRCAELLARRFGMFEMGNTVNVVVPIFGGEDHLEE